MLRLAALALALAAALAAPATASDLVGRFRGIDAAEGMRLEIEARGRGFRGVLTEVDGAARRFEADSLDGAAEAAVTLNEGRALLRLSPAAAGVSVVIAPFGEDDSFDPGRSRALAFLREGLESPPPPKRFVAAPTRAGAPVEARAFVDSYPFWEPLGAAWGYEGVEPAKRTVIRLFALVQADLLWKLCQSPERTAGLAEALRGQGVTCPDVIQAVRRAQAAGAPFNRFTRDVAAERALLLKVLDCADGPAAGAECRRVAQETASRAVSMETAATALRRYR